MQSNFPKIPLFFSATFFVLSLSIFLFAYKLTNDNNQGSEMKETKWQTEAARREGIKTLESSVKMIEGDRLQVEAHFAKSSNVVPFLDTIEGLAPKVGAKAEVSSVAPVSGGAGLLVGMTASGTFGSLYKFLTLLENSPYELEFVGMDMHRESSGDKSSTLPRWNVNLQMKLLSFTP